MHPKFKYNSYALILLLNLGHFVSFLLFAFFSFSYIFLFLFSFLLFFSMHMIKVLHA
ncbi:uncharacterized protein DS421_1g14730 [Arachis hypogaea]|nr:uncharacterized protein DS421_1g14730 [Arachis hypogaea]